MAGLATEKWVQYVLKLLVIYGVLYFGTLAIIGLSAPGGFYSPFVAKYLDYPSLLRKALLYSSDGLLKLWGYPSEIDAPFKVKFHGGHGINVIYGCLGTGVTSFWVAFIAANEAALKKKIFFITGGAIAIFIINAARMALLVIVSNGKRERLFENNHHTFFNIAAYCLILFMMYLFGKNSKKEKPAT